LNILPLGRQHYEARQQISMPAPGLANHADLHSEQAGDAL